MPHLLSIWRESGTFPQELWVPKNSEREGGANREGNFESGLGSIAVTSALIF